MKKSILLGVTVAMGATTFTLVTPAWAQSAPADGDACTSNVNGIALDVRPRSCAYVHSGGVASDNAAAIVNGHENGAATTGTG